MNLIKQYKDTYQKLWSLNTSIVLINRVDAINSVFSSLLWAFFIILSIQLLMNKVPSVRGWNREEVMVLGIVYSVVAGLFRVLFARGFNNMAQVIHKGELDMFLLKPVDAQFMLTASSIGVTGLIRVVVSFLFLLWFLPHAQIHPTVIGWGAFIFTGVCSILLLYSFDMIVCTLLIWASGNDALVELFEFLMGTSRYPQDIIRRSSLLLFAIFTPFFMVVNTPSKALIGRLQLQDVLVLIVLSLSAFVVSRLFWKYALRSYTGAGG